MIFIPVDNRRDRPFVIVECTDCEVMYSGWLDEVFEAFWAHYFREHA